MVSVGKVNNLTFFEFRLFIFPLFLYQFSNLLVHPLKLFTKEIIVPSHVNIFVYLISPIIALALALILWTLIPFSSYTVITNSTFSLVTLLPLYLLSIFSIVLSWSSRSSKYVIIPTIRHIAHMISYEVSLGPILDSIIIITEYYSIQGISII